MLYCSLLTTFSLFSSIAALPLNTETPSSSITIQNIEAISPASTTCVDAPKLGECRSATQVAQAFNLVFEFYNITTAGEKAAIISLEAFESGDFKYQYNYYPGNPGQGTRNMQSATFNLMYATSIQALSATVLSITDGADIGSLSDSQKNAVRALLTNEDIYDFGSGAWFLLSQCSQSIRVGLQAGTAGSWDMYITDCVQTSVSTARQEYWARATSTLIGA